MWSYSTVEKRQWICSNRGQPLLKRLICLVPLVLYSSLKTLHPSSWCHFLPLHTPLTLYYSSSWLGLWSVVRKASTPWCSTGRETQCDGTECLANTLWSGRLWRPVWTLRCGKQRDRPSINNRPLYSDTSSQRGSASDGHLPDLRIHEHGCVKNQPLTHTPTHTYTPKALAHDTSVSYTWGHCEAAAETLYAFMSLCGTGTDVHPYNAA